MGHHDTGTLLLMAATMLVFWGGIAAVIVLACALQG